MPLRCDGKVEKKNNPFFQIAKTFMNKVKNKEQNGGGKENNNNSNDVNKGFTMSNCKSKNFAPVEGTTEKLAFSDY